MDQAPLLRAFADLVRAGASVDSPDATGASVAQLVEAAAAQGHNAVADELLASIEALRAAAAQAGDQLLAAAEQGDDRQLAELLWDKRTQRRAGFHGLESRDGNDMTDSRADPNFQDGDGLSALHWALVRGHVTAASVLLRNGAEPQLQDKWGLAPIHAPFVTTAAEAAAAWADGTDDRGTHPLAHEPVPERGDLHSVLEVLLEMTTMDINQPDSFGGGTLLHYAVQQGVAATVQGLRWNGALSDIRDSQHKTASEHATADPEMQKALAATAIEDHGEKQCVPFPQLRPAEEQGAPMPTDEQEDSEESRASAAQALFGGTGTRAISFQRGSKPSDSGSEDSGSDGTGSDLFELGDEVIMLPWEELSAAQKDAAKVLGWCKESQWADGANMCARFIDRDFQRLTLTEREACSVLEIAEDDWDDMEQAQQLTQFELEPELEPEPDQGPQPAAAGDQQEFAGNGESARLLSSAALSAYRTHAISEVSSLLCSSQHLAISLLSRNNWDVGAC